MFIIHYTSLCLIKNDVKKIKQYIPKPPNNNFNISEMLLLIKLFIKINTCLLESIKIITAKQKQYIMKLYKEHI